MTEQNESSKILQTAVALDAYHLQNFVRLQTEKHVTNSSWLCIHRRPEYSLHINTKTPLPDEENRHKCFTLYEVTSHEATANCSDYCSNGAELNE